MYKIGIYQHRRVRCHTLYKYFHTRPGFIHLHCLDVWYQQAMNSIKRKKEKKFMKKYFSEWLMA